MSKHVHTRAEVVMRSLSCSLILFVVIISPHGTKTMAQNKDIPAPPPVARKVVRNDTFHGGAMVDNYYWLREKTNPEVIAYLEAENAYTNAVMKTTENFQEALYKEMLGRIKETDVNVPYREGDYLYYSRTEQGKQYPI